VKKTTGPPRLAIWLLTRRLSDEWHDFVVGDLEEEFSTRSGDSLRRSQIANPINLRPASEPSPKSNSASASFPAGCPCR
jgi:hypothetical protein